MIDDPHHIFKELDPEDRELYELIMRRSAELLFKKRPHALYNQILLSLLKNLISTFHNRTFGVIAPCQVDWSKKDKFETLYKFSKILLKHHLYSICHRGFWDMIDTRCFFIPGLTREKAKELTIEINREVYYWGEYENWICCETESNKIFIHLID